MTVANVIQVVSIILKIFSFMRVYEKIGDFWELFMLLMKESSKFTLFFMMWIIIFAIMYQILGIDIDIDYEDLSIREAFCYYFIFSWNNSVSNPSEPDDSFWTKNHHDPDSTTLTLMKTLVYFVWIMNQYILLIILLNLLISIMSHNYECYMSNQSLYTYQ